MRHLEKKTDLEDANFPDGVLPDLLVLVRLFNLFNGDDLPRFLVPSLQDDAVRAADRGPWSQPALFTQKVQKNEKRPPT